MGYYYLAVNQAAMVETPDIADHGFLLQLIERALEVTKSSYMAPWQS